MTDKINLGIISYAHPHAAKYAAAIAACPWADLVGIAGLGVNSNLAAEEAERHGVPYYADYRELLARDGLVGVYVGTEPTHHLEVVTEAAARGKHILCDKPIALTLAEADEIIRLARDAGVKLMVPFNPRFQLPLMKVKAALESGEAGELVSIFAIKYGKLPTKIPGPADYSWLIDPEQAGGGGFLDIGIHAVDGLRWLAGSEASRVYAHIGTALCEGLPVDDIGTMTVEFENGVVGALSAGWANPDSYPTWLDVRFEILTTKAAFLIDSPYHDYWCYGPDRAERQYWWRRDVDGLVGEFARAILEDRGPAISGEDARAALAIALAAYESSASGKVIALEHG
ncbi:MAG: Gfo/Idh/MocA family oxidoreductase [Chloroflexi bacterium]|nr:Gfo/Idh/MocA family oxidoreductase [Chloroflexota bacterium]